MSTLQLLSKVLREIEKILKTIDSLASRSQIDDQQKMFTGFYKGKTILVSTDSLLWMGDFQQIENDFVVLSNAIAIGTNTGVEVISTPQVFVEIPLLKVASVSIGTILPNKAVDAQTKPLPETPSNLWRKVEKTSNPNRLRTLHY